MSEPALITTEQLAARWQMSPGTLEIWRQQGKGPKFVKMIKNHPQSDVRYRMKTILKYEQENEIKPV